jgi:hypothetical protein
MGEDFTPLTPNAEQIHIEDIAHALSLICRANGHFVRFYSVAQHCINCANEAAARGLPAGLQLACLLHDGSEAYISDITRPVKKHLPQYREIEENLQAVIYERFLKSPLTAEEHALVDTIDNDVLVCEFNALMKKAVFGELPIMSSQPCFDFKDFGIVENEFLSMYRRVSKNV